MITTKNLSQDSWRFLTLRHLPARLNSSEAAILLGVEEHCIAILVKAGFLTPLGRPGKSAPKHFARDHVLELGEDQRRMSLAELAITRHWAAKNRRRGTLGAAD